MNTSIRVSWWQLENLEFAMGRSGHVTHPACQCCRMTGLLTWLLASSGTFRRPWQAPMRAGSDSCSTTLSATTLSATITSLKASPASRLATRINAIFMTRQHGSPAQNCHVQALHAILLVGCSSECAVLPADSGDEHKMTNRMEPLQAIWMCRCLRQKQGSCVHSSLYQARTASCISGVTLCAVAEFPAQLPFAAADAQPSQQCQRQHTCYKWGDCILQGCANPAGSCAGLPGPVCLLASVD